MENGRVMDLLVVDEDGSISLDEDGIKFLKGFTTRYKCIFVSCSGYSRCGKSFLQNIIIQEKFTTNFKESYPFLSNPGISSVTKG